MKEGGLCSYWGLLLEWCLCFGRAIDGKRGSREVLIEGVQLVHASHGGLAVDSLSHMLDELLLRVLIFLVTNGCDEGQRVMHEVLHRRLGSHVVFAQVRDGHAASCCAKSLQAALQGRRGGD